MKMSWRKVGEASPLCTLGTEQTEAVRLRRRAIVSSVSLKLKLIGCAPARPGVRVSSQSDMLPRARRSASTVNSGRLLRVPG